MTLQFSLELPTHRVERPEEFVSADAIVELTRAAAAAGFSAVNLSDHPAPDTAWLDRGGHHALDPFVGLSFAATADPEIRLLTNIYVAAYRNPFLSAKLVQSLDLLSDGRLVLGVAAGYLEPEFRTLGVDFERRGALLDESLAVLDGLLAGDDVAGVRLRPTLGRRPPVWVGGNSRAAMRRAARFEGWMPFLTGGHARVARTAPIESLDDLAAGIAEVRSLREDPDAPFDICWSESFQAAADRRARAEALEAIGVTWFTVTIPGADRAALLEGIAAFGRDVIAR